MSPALAVTQTASPIWGALATLLSVAVFVGVIVWVLTRPRGEIERQARLPLEDDGVRPRPPGEGTS